MTEWVWAPIIVIIIAIVVGLISGTRYEEYNVTQAFSVFAFIAMLALGVVIGKILL